ncbi:MAG: hypothetical protein P4N60_09660 [Verrucomicrobiae bacterium]|nr:hypothetical protein [Verrucomicrobiae bacterium]
MKRIVRPEILDSLPPADPRALGSRRDLRRLNRLMRHPAIMAEALAKNWKGPTPTQITEIGAGDGRFLQDVAQRIGPRWPDVRATLLDRQTNATPETLAGFATLGWRAEALVTDIFDWPQNPGADEIVIANLFLHHFAAGPLAELLRLVSQRARLFIALEPRRAARPLLFSRLLWAVGCNGVTRHDAAVSVRAGFADNELSALWPDWRGWRLMEQRAGNFSHLFIARKFDHG